MRSVRQDFPHGAGNISPSGGIKVYCYNCMSKIADGSVKCPFCGMAASVQNAEHQLVCDTVLNGKYLVGNSIGEGGFGITYVGLDLNLNLKIA